MFKKTIRTVLKL